MAITRIDTAVDFDAEYPRVREWLISAFKYSANKIDERQLLQGLDERDYLLWTANNAACVTSLTEWRGHPVCVFFVVGGAAGKAIKEIFEEGLPVVEQYAREHNCKYVLGIGRIQWVRIVERYGFTTEGNEYYKEV